MGVGYYDPDEVAHHETYTSRVARIRAGAADPRNVQLAQGVSRVRANYPHMRAGEIVPLAQAGVVDPADPRVQAVATGSAKLRKRRTGLWGSVKDVAFAPLRRGAAALGELGEAASFVGKPVARYGAATVMAPLELIQAGVRTAGAVAGEVGAGIASGATVGGAIGLAGGPFAPISVAAGLIGGAVAGGVAGGVAGMRGIDVEGEVTNPLMQTTLGQHVVGGVSMGSGYLAGGEAHHRQAQAAQAAASINGHALTPGRMLVSAVAEPGSTPYNLLSGLVDAGVAMSKLDPASAALGGWSQYRKGLTSFERMGEKLAAGAVDGHRRDWMAEAAGEWLSNAKGAAVKSWLAKTTDFDTIRRQLKGVPAHLVSQITDAKTADEVDSILRPILGPKGITHTPKVGDPRFGYSVRRRARDSRLAQQLPSGRLDFTNADEAVEEFGRLQANMRIDVPQRSANNKALVDLISNGDQRGARKLAVETIFHNTAMRNADPNLASRWIRRVEATDAEAARYFREADALQTAPHGLVIGGETKGLALPGPFASELDDVLAIDKAAIRDMRQATSRYSRLIASGKWDAVTAVGDAAMAKWRPLVLIRGAWTVRIIAEEQLRMAGAGLNSAFHHPLSYLAMAIGDDGTLARTVARMPGGENIVERLGRARGGLKEEFVDMAAAEAEGRLRGVVNEYTEAMGRNQQKRGWFDTDSRRGRFTRNQTAHTYHRPTETSPQPDIDGYYEGWADKIERLNRDPVGQRVARGRPLDDDVLPVGAQPGPTGLYDWFEGGSGNTVRQKLIQEPGGMALQNRGGVEDLFSNAQREVDRIANGDLDILRAIETGELDGVAVRNIDGSLNKAFVDKLKGRTNGPDAVLGDGFKRSDMRTRYDKVTDNLFDFFMGRPSAKFSRSVTFRQKYWEGVETRIGSMTDEAQQAAIAEARKWNLAPETVSRLEAKARRGVGDMTIDEVDLLSKREGLNFTKQLLYDSAERGQLSDMLRLVFPFAEAQKEVLTRWAKLGTENPKILRRAQQVVDGARGAGFFYKDPMTGEENFAYPGSELITEKLLGARIKLGGQVKGLSIFGSGVMPGVGPAIQLPARWLLSDMPAYDQLRDLIDPMGQMQGEAEAGPESLAAPFIPAWARKVWTAATAPEDERMFANTVMDVWRSGVSSGRYSTETEEDIRGGLEKAKSTARAVFLVRGLASLGGAPAAVTPEYMAKDSSGKWHIADILRQDYRAMMDADPDNATAAFVEKYGENATAYMQSYTYTLTAAPNSPEAGAWVRTNEDVVERNPTVYGYFAPQGEDFDYQTYLRQIRSGERVALTPAQFAALAQDRVGKMVYYNLKDRFGPHATKPQREFLSQARDLIKEALPGFDAHLPLADKYKPEDQIEDLKKALDDPGLADNEIAEALRLYFRARDATVAQAVGAGWKGHQKAAGAAPLRAWLRELGESIVAEIPDFAPVWDRVLSREMIEDQTEEEVPGGGTVQA